MNPITRALRGFTLIEMAIVLGIIALLLGGGLTLLSAQIEQQKNKDTQRLLEEAKEALIGHAVRFGRLPCPADPTIASGAAGAGVERAPDATGCTGGAPALQGAVPWATLGLPELDAWGRRFTYRVSANFARSLTPPAQAAFTLADNGDMAIRSATAPAGAVLASQIPAVVVSHGPNGLRSYLPSGTQMGVSTDADETNNFAGVPTDFVSKTPTATFDDLVVWVTPAILANRMLQAQRLP